MDTQLTDPELISDVETEIEVLVDRWSTGSIGWSDIIAALVVVACSVAVAWLVRRLLRRFSTSWEGPAAAALDMIGQLVSVGIYLFGAAIVLEIFGFTGGPVLVLALLTLVFFLFLRPVVENLSSGLVLQLRGSCQPGAVVEIDDVLGVVKEVSTRTVVLVTSDGRTVHIPNSRVMDDRLTNYSAFGRRRSSLALRLPEGADVRGLTTRVSEAMTHVGHILLEPPPAVMVTGFDGAQLCVEVHFWHAPEFPAEAAAYDAVGRALVDLFETTESALANAAILVRIDD